MRLTDPRSRRRPRLVIRHALALGAATMVVAPADAQQMTVQTPPTHTVKRGDTLWDIAGQYLGDPFKWPEIYRINRDVVEDPHWIYPGEVLKLPGAQTTTVPLPPPTVAEPVVPRAQPPVQTVFSTQPAALVTPPAPPPAATAQPRTAAVRPGDFAAAPWVAPRDGPSAPGRVLGSAELPGIATQDDRPYVQIYEQVLFSPPVGSVAPERERYVTYVEGPLLEDVGRIIVPTGVIEVTRSPRNGEAGLARLIQMYGPVQVHQKLIAYEPPPTTTGGRPVPVNAGAEGQVRWIQLEPVLPSVGRFLVLNLSARDDVRVGDEVVLYEPRRASRDEGQLATPEVIVGRAQITRVTPQASTAIIIEHDQPKINTSTRVRVVARIP